MSAALASQVIAAVDIKTLWASAIPLTVLSVLLIVSGAVTMEHDKEITKPVVGLQAGMLTIGVLGAIAGFVLFMVAVAKQRNVKIGGVQFGGVRRGWY
jgi:hypothetical protein